MANLNFQQPPRSIASASLNNRSTAGGFGSSSLSGHVTPTSGMFPQSSANYAPSQQSQLSPNRSVQLSGSVGVGAGSSVGGIGGGIGTGGGAGGASQISSSGRTSIFGQRAFTERRTMQGLGSMVHYYYCSRQFVVRSIII